MSKQDNFVCELCNKHYKTEKNFIIHKKKYHSESFVQEEVVDLLRGEQRNEVDLVPSICEALAEADPSICEVSTKADQKEPTSHTDDNLNGNSTMCTALMNAYHCKYCNNIFKYKQSVKIHERKCKNKFKKINRVETNPVETNPVETNPVETNPVETNPVETNQDETNPVETNPVETNPVETNPVETNKDIIITKLTHKSFWVLPNIINRFFEWIFPIKNKNI